MKYRRFNARRDNAEPAIVNELEKFGYECHRELPVDLLCLKIVSEEQLLRVLKRPGGYLLCLPVEVKTPQGKKNPKEKVDKRQQKQIEFCERQGIPKPTTPFEALLAVGEKVSL